MATTTINTSASDDLRIKAAQEYEGFTGTNAAHQAEFKRRLIGFAKRSVLAVEADIAKDASQQNDLDIT